jgi:hypothetical protein
VPPDAIEPLTQSSVESEGSNGVASELEPPISAPSQTERTAFEAGEFWERGDTQEFIGVASEPDRSTRATDETGPVGGTADAGLQPMEVDSPRAAIEAEPAAAVSNTHQLRRRMRPGRGSG